MSSVVEPKEPVIVLNKRGEGNTFENPSDAANKTICQAFQQDEVMAYFSKPGHTRAYIEAQLRWRMTEENYQIHVLGQFDCVAIVLDTADVDRSRLKQPVQEKQMDLQEIIDAIKTEDVERLQALRMSEYMAKAAVHCRPERWGQLLQMCVEAEQSILNFIQEHGHVLYLHMMGAREQGGGRGSAMLRHLAAVADAQQKWIYLESDSRKNTRLYIRHGFEELGELQIGGPEGKAEGAPVLMRMGRPPELAQ